MISQAKQGPFLAGTSAETAAAPSPAALHTVAEWLDSIMHGYAEKYADTLTSGGLDTIAEFADVELGELLELGVLKRHAKRIVKATIKAQSANEA